MPTGLPSPLPFPPDSDHPPSTSVSDIVHGTSGFQGRQFEKHGLYQCVLLATCFLVVASQDY